MGLGIEPTGLFELETDEVYASYKNGKLHDTNNKAAIINKNTGEERRYINGELITLDTTEAVFGKISNKPRDPSAKL